MKKIFIVGIVGLPAAYGGFESLVENLVRFSTKDVQYGVFCSSKSHSPDLKSYNGAELHYINLKANGVQSVPYDIISIFRALINKPDVILILGVSGAIVLPLVKFFSGCKVITNIDGLEWKRGKWGRFAKSFLKLSEAIAIKFSDIVITDNQAISDYVLSVYKRESKVIAYGGDHALVDVELDEDIEEPYYLTICRIELENNVHLILDAFSQSSEKIKFVGNWSSSEYGRNLIKKYADFPNIELINPLYDICELYKLRKNCKGYIHGHSAGGTNPSLVEAMHFSKPVYAFDCTFNRFTSEDKAFYFKKSQDLLSLLNIPPFNVDKNSLDMKEIAQRRYIWELITKQYEGLY